jgi:hypothetical protein
MSKNEKTFMAVAKGLYSNPAYLLLFGLGVMASTIVLGAFMYGDSHITILSAVSWLIFLVSSICVVGFTEKSKLTEDDGNFGPPDQAAVNAFVEGPSAENLSGTWDAFWFDKEGNPYAGEPKERVTITCKGARMFISAYNESLDKTYWMYGRLSDNDTVILIYWSALESGFSSLVGTVIMELDTSFEARGRKMDGLWTGRGRNGEIIDGKVSWQKRG